MMFLSDLSFPGSLKEASHLTLSLILKRLLPASFLVVIGSCLTQGLHPYQDPLFLPNSTSPAL